MPNWKKVIVSGSDAPIKNLTASGTTTLQGSHGVPTNLLGRSATGQVNNVTLGTGLSISSGVLTATGGGGGGGTTIMTGTSATAAGTDAKTLTLDAPNASYTPAAGDYFMIKYTSGTTAGTPTLNINGSGAKNIRLANANANNTGHTTAANGVLMYYYDGTYYHLIGSQQQATTTYAEISEANIINTSNSSVGLITGRRAEYLMANEATKTRTLTNKTLTSPKINLGSDASGDIYYRNSSGDLLRLAAGSVNQILHITGSSTPIWKDNLPDIIQDYTLPTGYTTNMSKLEIDATQNVIEVSYNGLWAPPFGYILNDPFLFEFDFDAFKQHGRNIKLLFNNLKIQYKTTISQPDPTITYNFKIKDSGTNFATTTGKYINVNGAVEFIYSATREYWYVLSNNI